MRTAAAYCITAALIAGAFCFTLLCQETARDRCELLIESSRSETALRIELIRHPTPITIPQKPSIHIEPNETPTEERKL